MSARRRSNGADRIDVSRWLTEHDPLVVVADRNPVLETLGDDPRSPAAEAAWLHRLGPSAMCAHRRLVTFLEAVGDGHAIPLKALASDLGLPGGDGRNSKIVRTLGRLVDFGVAAPRNGALAVTLALPPARRPMPRLEAAITPATGLPASRPQCGLRSTLDRAAEVTPEVTT